MICCSYTSVSQIQVLISFVLNSKPNSKEKLFMSNLNIILGIRYMDSIRS